MCSTLTEHKKTLCNSETEIHSEIDSTEIQY